MPMYTHTYTQFVISYTTLSQQRSKEKPMSEPVRYGEYSDE